MMISFGRNYWVHQQASRMRDLSKNWATNPISETFLMIEGFQFGSLL
jgi:hypothetical protein